MSHIVRYRIETFDSIEISNLGYIGISNLFSPPIAGIPVFFMLTLNESFDVPATPVSTIETAHIVLF